MRDVAVGSTVAQRRPVGARWRIHQNRWARAGENSFVAAARSIALKVMPQRRSIAGAVDELAGGAKARETIGPYAEPGKADLPIAGPEIARHRERDFQPIRLDQRPRA